MPLTPEANLRVGLVENNVGARGMEYQHTRPAPQPGHWPNRAHERYHHCRGQALLATKYFERDEDIINVDSILTAPRSRPLVLMC